MKSISKDIFLTNIYFKDIENIEPAVKSGVNYLFKMVDAMLMMLQTLKKDKMKNRQIDTKIEKQTNGLANSTQTSLR